MKSRPMNRVLCLSTGLAASLLAVSASVVAAQPKVVVETVSGYSSTYTVTAHLKDGATLTPLLGAGPQGAGQNGCRGWYNTFTERNVAGFTMTSQAQGAVAVVSGSFHNDYGVPAFPIRVGGWTATYGYECNSSAGANDLLMLTIRNSEGRAYISPFSLQTFNGSGIAPDVVAGLKTSFAKYATSRVGRNYVGLTNPYNGGYGTVIFLVSKGLTQSEALTILKNKGCPDSQIMQLDGSTVAQLSRKINGVWQHTITDPRGMPQSFAIFE